MNNNDEGKEEFFDILINKQSYLSFIYALFVLPLSLLFVVSILFLLFLGIILFPFGLGVNILSFYIQVLQYLTKKEEQLIEYYIGVNLPKVAIKIQQKGQIFLNLKENFKDRRNWTRLIYFIIKPIYIIPFILPALIFLLMGVTLIYMPINSVFGHINLFGLYSTDSFIEVIFAYFVSFIFIVGLLHLNIFALKAFCSTTKNLLSR